MDLNKLTNLESNSIGVDLYDSTEALFLQQGHTLATPFDSSNIDNHPDGTRIWATLTYLYAQTLFEIVGSLGIEIANASELSESDDESKA